MKTDEREQINEYDQIDKRDQQVSQLLGWQDEKVKNADGEGKLLDSDDHVAPDRVRATMPPYRNPIIRAFTAFGMVGGLFWLLFNSFFGGFSASAPQQVANKSNNDTRDDVIRQQQQQIDQLKKQNSDLTANNLTLAQKDDLENLRQTKIKKPLAHKRNSKQEKPTKQVQVIVAKSTATPSSATTQAVPRPSARIIRRNLINKAKPTPSPKSVTIVKATPTAIADPTQQWLDAANIGSYGSVSSHSSTSESSNEVTSALSDDNSSSLTDDEQANNNLDTESPWQINGGTGQASASTFEATTDQENNSNTGNYQQSNYYSNAKSLMVGTKVRAKLDTRIAWTNDMGAELAPNFRIKLSEPLHQADGSIVIPKGGYILARLIDIGNSATVQLLPTAITTVTGQLLPVHLPPGAILIQGKNGDPLQAKVRRRNDSKDSLGNTLLSEVSKASGLLGSGRIAPQVAGEVLDQVQNRYGRSQQSGQPRLDIFVLDRGTSVELYVNQPVSL